jgi:hypothetical protein
MVQIDHRAGIGTLDGTFGDGDIDGFLIDSGSELATHSLVFAIGAPGPQNQAPIVTIGLGGNPLGGEIRANTYTTEDQSGAAIAALPGGGYVVAWRSFGQDGSEYGVYLQRFNPALGAGDFLII